MSLFYCATYVPCLFGFVASFNLIFLLEKNIFSSSLLLFGLIFFKAFFSLALNLSVMFDPIEVVDKLLLRSPPMQMGLVLTGYKHYLRAQQGSDKIKEGRDKRRRKLFHYSQHPQT